MSSMSSGVNTNTFKKKFYAVIAMRIFLVAGFIMTAQYLQNHLPTYMYNNLNQAVRPIEITKHSYPYLNSSEHVVTYSDRLQLN